MRVLIRYLISGGTAALCHFSVLILLVEFTTVNATLATMIGFCLAVLVNYTMQFHWTFELSGPHSRILTRYVITTFAMLGVNTIIFWMLNAKLDIMYVLAQVIATGVVTIMNFLINKHFIFVESQISESKESEAS